MAGGFKNLEFSFPSDTGVIYSCSLVFNGVMYVFGGTTPHNRQISRVRGCGLVHIGNLDFSFYDGACSVTQNKILLCFDELKWEGRVCRKASSPTGLFSKIPESNYHHFRTAIASNGGKSVTNFNSINV